MIKISRKITKGSPNQKRIVQPTLASFHSFNSHIDLIAFCYEAITEEKEKDLIDLEDAAILGDEMYDVMDSIEMQLGVEKYVEVLLFIRELKKKYVTDLRTKTYNIAIKKTFVFFDDTGEKVISHKFNCNLILAELQGFVVNPKVLKKLSEKLFRTRKNKRETGNA